jgi:hypothetical protein
MPKKFTKHKRKRIKQKKRKTDKKRSKAGCFDCCPPKEYSIKKKDIFEGDPQFMVREYPRPPSQSSLYSRSEAVRDWDVDDYLLAKQKGEVLQDREDLRDNFLRRLYRSG